MKKILTTLCLALAVGMTASAQTVGRDSIGLRLPGNTPAEAITLDYGRPIYTISLSPKEDYLVVMFRNTNKKRTKWKNKGEFGLVDMATKEMLWTSAFDYNNNTLRLTSRGVMKADRSGQTTMLDRNTGQSLWTKQFRIVKVDDSLGVVLAYDNSTSHRLRGYRQSDGMELWNIKAPHDNNWGWTDVQRVDSTRLLMVNDDVMLFDEQTGEHYIYEAKTGVEDAKGALLAGLMAVAGGAVGAAMGTAYYYLPTMPNHITKLCADVIRQDSLYYFADRRSVVALDSLMRPVWKQDLPSKTATRAILLADDSLLYMLNLGYGYKNGWKVKAGRPFIAAFDSRTGKQRFLNMLTMRKDIVTDAILTDGGVYMMFDDGLAYKSDLSDSIVNITPWNYRQHGRLTSIAHMPIYIGHKLKGTYEPFDFDGQNCLVMTDRGDAFVVNERLDI